MSATTLSKKEPTVWQNWSGSQQHRLTAFSQPESLEELIRLLARAGTENMKVRCVGSAHSFVPFWTDDVIVSLDGFSDLLEVNNTACTAKMGAGIKLHDLGPLLWAQGLSLTQQGDIDRQSLAGALSTGTHGTGADLRNLPSACVAFSLLTAAGNLIEVTPQTHADVFAAGRLSLGLLGVITDVTLKLDPAFYLHEKNWQTSVEACAEELPHLISDNRHFEFFWVPNSDCMQMKTLNISEESPHRISSDEVIGPAFEIFPSEREVKFNEMEYSVPAEEGWACFAELREMLLRDFPKLPWPLEYRTLASDHLPLSPAFERDSVTISVHQGAERDYTPLFEAAESVFRNYQGRPHWGKCHTLTAEQLSSLYPKFEDFLALRAELDPQQRFLTASLARLFPETKSL